MSPTVLRVSGPSFERNGETITPRAMVSTCEVEGCTGIASFGFAENGKYLTYCRDHLPTTEYKDRGTR